MSEDGNGGIMKKLKPFYGFALGVAVALGGERLVYYLRDKYKESRNREIEELADRIIKKYNQKTVE